MSNNIYNNISIHLYCSFNFQEPVPLVKSMVLNLVDISTLYQKLSILTFNPFDWCPRLSSLYHSALPLPGPPPLPSPPPRFSPLAPTATPPPPLTCWPCSAPAAGAGQVAGGACSPSCPPTPPRLPPRPGQGRPSHPTAQGHRRWRWPATLTLSHCSALISALK